MMVVMAGTFFPHFRRSANAPSAASVERDGQGVQPSEERTGSILELFAREVQPGIARTGASSPRPLYLTECLLIGPKENAA
jgi:hypothetical protein